MPEEKEKSYEKIENKNKIKEYFKKLGEELIGKRNPVTGKKFEKTHENIESATTEHGKIQNYLNEGYLVISEGKEYITFKKSKKFNLLLFIGLIFLGGFPALIYLIYYASRPSGSITIKK